MRAAGISTLILFFSTVSIVNGFSNGLVMNIQRPSTPKESLSSQNQQQNEQQRRQFLLSSAFRATVTASAAISFLNPEAAVAAGKRYVLNEETGDYDEVIDPDWQTEWKSRLDKIQTMSKDEVFMVAKGAGNMELKDGEESPASKKRRAMAGCRDEKSRRKVAGGKGIDEKTCTNRVFNGEVDFMIDVM
mmetsp:Transcript_49042/g.59365  ORF Transcript_49042/g.59365 Transcript_49042/m.59365 type:complete len:189 (+) Transcript_49042:61-627(+)|eukprot:CAMPEP_0172512324 /NCGR_PEP_ID=MMETSP1066-20121228/243571_1 /TAXON_ID=671091 /ORGANISM="Coscinodiscus wailesii, Strain CCMP2513" /LENGTH=188 /DNA_ID=CAMNT_0013292079 /DNA_START=24 /DNA_END=590 /DNA_ORIENTATION=+